MVADARDPAGEREQERENAKAAAASTVDGLIDAFLERYVRTNLRGANEVERIFDKYVRPQIGSKSIYHIRRRDVVEMLDGIEDQNGPVMSDRTLAHLRKAFAWHATRDDQFNTPIIRGMARTKPRERARKRVLDDQEIRDLWRALDAADSFPSCYPAFVRTLLLTAQRRSEVSHMTWSEIDGDIWVIPAKRGDKQGHKTGDQTGDKVVPLSAEVLALLGKPGRPRGFVFSTSKGCDAFSGFSKGKRALDKKIAELRKVDKRKPMAPWVIHDLRRTARSLMSRAGVTADIGERVLGHVLGGVRGIYDRHEFIDEKRDALERLATLVGQILDPPTENVVSLARRRG
jgi:integrase